MPKDALTSKDLRIVAELTAQGWPLTSIARLLGVDVEGFERWRAKDKKLAAAYQDGRDRRQQKLVDSLYQRAVNQKDKTGDRSAKFLLRNEYGYVDYGEGTADEGSRVAVVINLPGAMSEADYRKKLAAAHPELLAEIEAETVDTTAELVR